MLNLMYITNRPEIAQIAESAGVDRIFVDLEYIGKSDRQGGMDTVQSHHTLDDVKKVAESLMKAELLVRVNPIHEASSEHLSSEEEINTAIENGADILMLPYFKTVDEVSSFLKMVDGRVKTMLLLETPEAVEQIDSILELSGIDFIHIGLNDLSLGYGMKFMFQPLVDGTVERLSLKFRNKNIPFGFGGIASMGMGLVPAEMIIKEHYRLGSTCAILSRSFCNADKEHHLGVISSTFVNGIREIRDYEKIVEEQMNFFTQNHILISEAVNKIIQEK